MSVVGLMQNQPDAFRIAGEVFPSHRADDPLAAPIVVRGDDYDISDLPTG